MMKKTVFGLGKFKYILLVLLFFVLSFGTTYLFFMPKIVFNDNRAVISVNSDYVEYKAYAETILGSTEKKVNVVSNIDTSKIGTYDVIYKVDTFLGSITKTKKVSVVDETAPEIILNGTTERKICPSELYTEEGFIAVDNYDGDITNKVVIKEQDSGIVYSVVDTSSNSFSITRNILKVDDTPPSISLKGYSTEYAKINTTYNDKGYNVEDNCSNNINVQNENNINMSAVGKYYIKYIATDEYGNSASVSRNVVVFDPANFNFNTTYKRSHIYLTFDDGPSYSITPGVLDILRDEGVKATFFVTNQGGNLAYLIKRAYDEGHTIALHTATHEYSYIYSSVDNYFNDLNNVSNYIANIIGFRPMIMRFPGGSSNTVSRNYYRGIMTILTNEVVNRGYRYFDWNVASGDSGGTSTSSGVYYNVINGLSHDKTNVVLMHDFSGNYKTLNALRDIINYGKANGYTFAAIDDTTPVVRQSVAN